ncbi:MAG TPA: hypothetical protein VH436_28400 [Vicinamibacterales bacterium]|jgi:hypothetical protein
MAVSKRMLAAVVLTLLCVAVPLEAQAPTPSGQAPKNQSEYIPIDQLPPQDQLPAAPLLIAAYSFVLVVFFLYVLSLARRLTSVQRDVDRLGATLKQHSKA